MKKAVMFDEFAMHCKYFKNSNYDYECRHPKQEERDYVDDIEVGQCFSCSCPLGIEAEQEDYDSNSGDIDWDGLCSDGTVPCGEYLLVDTDDNADADQKEVLFAYDKFMHRYDKQWLDEHDCYSWLVSNKGAKLNEK